MATSIYNPSLSTEAEIDDRYKNIQGEYSFGLPSSASGNEGFAVPVIVFRFKSPYGNDIEGAPILYIRSPNGLNLTQSSNYSQGGPIFGGTGQNGVIDSSGNSYFGTVFSGIAQSVASQLNSAVTKARGYLESAGQSGIDQAEFTTKNVINPFQQLLYKGPAFKPYAFPFTFRPKNIEEARSMMAIISAFKIASSPKIQKGSYRDIDVGEGLFSGAIDDALGGIAGLGGDTALSFGYPDLVEFDIKMYTGEGSGNNDVQTLYSSLPCVINQVSTDYGQQKMTFFIPEDNSTEYYPTEITMSIQLQEVAYRSLKEAIDESDPTMKRGIK